MRINYTQDDDALYIRLKENDIENSDEIADDIILDFDKNGSIVGIEILSASEKADVQQILVQSFEKVMVDSSAV